MTAGKPAIVNMRPEHLLEILAIEDSSFLDPCTENMFREEMKEDGRRIFLVLEDEGRVAGYVLGWVVLDEFHLGNIAIISQRRRTGWGRRLLQEVLEQAYRQGCRMASLEVRISNEPAIELYRAFGFRPIAIRKKYYQNEDALVMMSDIAPRKPC